MDHDELVVYPPNRKCVWGGCITILNQYNEGPRCLLHTQKHEAHLRAIEAALEVIREPVALAA